MLFQYFSHGQQTPSKSALQINSHKNMFPSTNDTKISG